MDIMNINIRKKGKRGGEQKAHTRRYTLSATTQERTHASATFAKETYFGSKRSVYDG